MQSVARVKLLALAAFALLGVALLLTDNFVGRRSYARSSGPDPGFTGAPGEFNCRECHLEDGAPPGSITIDAPQTYVPGQTYQITVNESNPHPTRARWGFQLTAVDDTGNRAGTLQSGPDGLTQVIGGTLGAPARQYVEHTSAGTFRGQTGGASWTFNWTAPADDVGPVLLYTAGNQANNDENTSGDSINFTFAAIQPAAQTPDFVVTVTPSSQVILPGASGSYTVTVTPSNGFTGAVSLSATGLPANSYAALNAPSVQITDATPKTATLTIFNGADVPLGNFTLTVAGTTAGGVVRTGLAALVTGPSMQTPDLFVRAAAAGLEQPTALAFINGSEFFVAEKASGRVKRVVNGAVQSTVLDLAVNSASERGLLGMALHPNFAANKFVYLFWTESTTGADTADVTAVPLLGNRVDRYVWNGSALAFDRNLIRLRARQEDDGQPPRGNHNGGVLRFGPDGKLYILFGDNGRRGFMQNLTTGLGPAGKDDQFGGPEPDDAHLTGVILRLNDDGSTPADNPFFNAATNLTGEAAANVKKVFAYGVRNGFGMAFDPQGGGLWTQENGDDAFDEINRVPAGFNGGWVQVMGPLARLSEYKSIEVARGNSLQQNRWLPSLIADTAAEAIQRLYQLPGSTYTDPQFSWKYAVAPSPLGFAAGNGLGPQYAGDMFVGASRLTLLGGYLFRLRLTPNRLAISSADTRLADGVADNLDKFELTESESLVAGRDFGITTDIQTGPDGALYVLSLSNGVLYRVSAQPTLFVARLSGGQVVPPTSSTARGTATLLLSADETTARVSLDYCCLTQTSLAAHLHGPAATGANGPVIATLSGSPFENLQVSLTPAQVADLKAGLLYIDVHNADFPDGAIRGQFGGSPASAPSVFEFEGTASTSVAEGAGSLTLNVVRLGDATLPATVDVSTHAGTASDRADFNAAAATLRFAPGERTKPFTVFLNDDAFVEGGETFTVTLSGAPAGSALGALSTQTVTISDNDSSPPVVNPIDDAQFFVRRHYVDFLGREPDQAGLQFWTNQITECEQRPEPERQGCREVRRINVSGAFFLSIEFQETGFLVQRFYEASFDRRPTYLEFLVGTQEVARGLVVGQPGWEALLEANKAAYAERWVQRADFLAEFPVGMSAQDYAAKLFARAGVAPSAAELQAAAGAYGNGDVQGRARALRSVAESDAVKGALKSPAFVLMQYFGYLRRDADQAGFDFWLGKLNSFGGDYVAAEMVKAFITSGEYRGRFGP